MDLTVIELDLTPEGPSDRATAVGALVGLCFLLVLALLDRWVRRATTDK